MHLLTVYEGTVYFSSSFHPHAPCITSVPEGLAGKFTITPNSYAQAWFSLGFTTCLGASQLPALSENFLEPGWRLMRHHGGSQAMQWMVAEWMEVPNRQAAIPAIPPPNQQAQPCIDHPPLSTVPTVGAQEGDSFSHIHTKPNSKPSQRANTEANKYINKNI